MSLGHPVRESLHFFRGKLTESQSTNNSCNSVSLSLKKSFYYQILKTTTIMIQINFANDSGKNHKVNEFPMNGTYSIKKFLFTRKNIWYLQYELCSLFVLTEMVPTI